MKKNEKMCDLKRSIPKGTRNIAKFLLKPDIFNEEETTDDEGPLAPTGPEASISQMNTQITNNIIAETEQKKSWKRGHCSFIKEVYWQLTNK